LRDHARNKKDSRSAQQAVKKLEKDCLVRLKKYEEQEKMLHGRSSYAKTDRMPAACA